MRGPSKPGGVLWPGESLDKATILEIPCDVLVPAAIGGVLDEDVARKVQCRYVVEAANGPTTPEGDGVLREQGIVVLPDIYTNGGARLPKPRQMTGRSKSRESGGREREGWREGRRSTLNARPRQLMS